MFLQRLQKRALALTEVEQQRVDEIWAIVESASSSSSVAPEPRGVGCLQHVDTVNAESPSVSAASSSLGRAECDSVTRAAATHAMDGSSGTSLPLWCCSDWGEFEDDRRMLKELVAWVHSNDGASPGTKSSQWKQYWFKTRALHSVDRSSAQGPPVSGGASAAHSLH